MRSIPFNGNLPPGCSYRETEREHVPAWCDECDAELDADGTCEECARAVRDGDDAPAVVAEARRNHQSKPAA